MTNLADVKRFILSEATLPDTEALYTILRGRTEQLRLLRASDVSQGSKVELTNLRPKYLNGLTGTVRKIDGDTATVDLDNPIYRGNRWGEKVLRVPLTTLQAAVAVS